MIESENFSPELPAVIVIVHVVICPIRTVVGKQVPAVVPINILVEVIALFAPFLTITVTVPSAATLKSSQLKPGAIIHVSGKNLVALRTPKYAKELIATRTTMIAYP